MRFKRNRQRRVNPGEPDVVTLRDIKDVVIFQVQQKLPADFLLFFHTTVVDRFLRTLILYCFYYVQTWEVLTLSSSVNASRIREGQLKPAQRRLQQNLATLRVLLARDYHTLLMGEGAARRYHHMSNGVQSWSQRDARLWELLLRLAVRVTWVALQRRYLNLLDAEVGRLFRGKPFELAAHRRQGSLGGVATAAARSDECGGGRLEDLRDEILHGPVKERYRSLFTRSPATIQILGNTESKCGREADWKLLAIGRLPLKCLNESLRRLEAVYTLSEEELVRVYSSYIGILGMPRSNLDVMLNLRDRQRRQELLLLSGGSSIGQQCSFLFPVGEEDTEVSEPDPPTFPILGL